VSYWETIAVGDRTELGSYRFTAEAIRSFAAKYDPQPFHLDEEAAKRSLFGGLCASGWHTASAFMRLNVEHMRRTATEWAAAGNVPPAIGPSPGIRNLRWLRPVYAGDTIRYASTVTAKRVSASKPGWGIVEATSVGVGAAGDAVFSVETAGFIGLE
jgi:acyl dehydratase